jgi:thioredoxin reductase (NADPH)
VLEEIKGDGIVESVVIKNIKTGELTEMETNGVFFFVGTVPKTGFLRGKVELDEKGYIITNEQMETSVPGVYAVGDARVKYLRQVITAAADGAVAAVAAEKYLAEEEGFKEQVLNADKPVMVAFWAPQNEASIAAVGLLEQTAAELGDSVKLVKIDTYRNQRVAKRYGVTSIPAVVFFEGGQAVAKLCGDFSAEEVKKQIAAGK